MAKRSYVTGQNEYISENPNEKNTIKVCDIAKFGTTRAQPWSQISSCVIGFLCELQFVYNEHQKGCPSLFV